MKPILLIFLSLLLFSACKNDTSNKTDDKPLKAQFFDAEAPVLITPIDLTSGEAKLILADYFMQPENISAITTSGVTTQWSVGEKEVVFNEVEVPLSSATVTMKDGTTYTIPLIAKMIAEGSPNLRTLEHENGKVTIASTGEITALLAMVQNKSIAVNNENGMISLIIPDHLTYKGRSTLRVWAANDKGLSNDILVPLQDGEPVQASAQLNRADKEAQIMYFPLIDRFNNGNNDNDEPIVDEKVLAPANYQGGDIAGVTAKIKDGYFKDLAINTIWLSPITQNPLIAYQEYIEPQRYYSGYHGYWPISSSKVDHRFGTEAELKELVETAHANDINVVLDFICNHVHEEHPMYKKHKDWATDLILKDGSRNLRRFDGATRLTTWFDTFLPSLDFSKQEVIDTQVDSAMFWIKNYGLDGYRQDASKHVPIPFWRALTRKLKEEVIVPQQRQLYQVGETYGSDELIKTYIGSGVFDSQFDFNTYFTSRDVICKEDRTVDDLVRTLNESFKYYGFHHSMSNITGNHDQPRFASLAGGGLKFDESDKEAGWKRAVQVGEPIGYKRMQLLQALNMGIPGVPCTYYGDEIGMEGAGDPDSRHMMRFADLKPEEMETKSITAKLSMLRKNRLSLTYGDTEVIKLNDYCIAIIRNYFDESTIVFLNISKENQKVNLALPKYLANKTFKAAFDNTFTNTNGTIEIELPATGFEYLL